MGQSKNGAESYLGRELLSGNFSTLFNTSKRRGGISKIKLNIFV